MEDFEDFPCFCKNIVVPASELKKLSIPIAFTKEHGSSFSDHAHLRAPGGLEYKVELTKLRRKFSFGQGFKEFADNYCIDLGHFLLFYYLGDSKFKVLIYDTSSCEIDYHDFHEDEDSSEDEYEDDFLEGENKVEMSKAYMDAEAFHCDNPNFIVAMNMSYIKTDSRLWVPQLHAQRYLKKAGEALLRVDDRAWDVSVTLATGAVRIGRGWPRFVRANQLEVDDVCKFELVNRTAYIYRVHIFRRKH